MNTNHSLEVSVFLGMYILAKGGCTNASLIILCSDNSSCLRKRKWQKQLFQDSDNFDFGFKSTLTLLQVMS